MPEIPHRDGLEDRNPGEIARLNDELRQNLLSPGHNRVVMTRGIADLIGDTGQFVGYRRRAELLRLVRDYEDFSPDNDPYGEHDLGVFAFVDAHCFWKIDYYDGALSNGSEHPADPNVTVRVLTILLVEEY